MTAPTVTQARQAVAAAINTVVVAGTPTLDVAVQPRSEPKPGQGWTQPPTLTPAGFGGVNAATLTTVVVLGPELLRADDLYSAWASPILTAVTNVVAAFDVTVAPEQLLAGDGITAAVYVLSLTLTLEVQ